MSWHMSEFSGGVLAGWLLLSSVYSVFSVFAMLPSSVFRLSLSMLCSWLDESAKEACESQLFCLCLPLSALPFTASPAQDGLVLPSRVV